MKQKGCPVSSSHEVCNAKLLMGLELWPNPASEKVTIVLDNEAPLDLNVQLVDL